MLLSQETILPKSAGRFLRDASSFCFVALLFSLAFSSAMAQQRIEIPAGETEIDINGVLRSKQDRRDFIFYAEAGQAVVFGIAFNCF